MKLQLTSDPHSPEIFRVNGPLSNMPEFAKDFNCEEKSKMHIEKKCKVW
jgi:predicted metalloendopeptidase